MSRHKVYFFHDFFQHCLTAIGCSATTGSRWPRATLNDKQCAGKDFVVRIARLLIAGIFLRY
jgi:hypothetical protein